jgi:hypothetical protein
VSSIASLLDHRVTLVRRVAVLDDFDEPVLDDYGHPLTVEERRTDVAVAIQPRSGKEIAATHQAGTAIATHMIFAVDRDITTADAIEHDPADCPKLADLPAGRYELDDAADAAGRGHHLELGARLVGEAETAPSPGGGSGS